MNMEWLNHSAGLRGLGMSRTGSSHCRQYMVAAGWGLVAAAIRWDPEQAAAAPRAGSSVEGVKCQTVRETQQKKINRPSFHTAAFTPKHCVLMLELLILNSGMSLSWWKVSCVLNHPARDRIISCWCRSVFLVCSV